MYYKKRKEGRAGAGRDRDEPPTEKGGEKESMVHKCHNLRQRLSRSKLAHSQIWGAGVLNHHGLGARVDR